MDVPAGSPHTRVIDGYKPPYGGWELTEPESFARGTGTLNLQAIAAALLAEHFDKRMKEEESWRELE